MICVNFRKGTELADFKARRQVIELFDIRADIAFEMAKKLYA
jgi:hypothetical protein